MNAADPSSSRNDSDAPSTLDAETRALCATQAR